MIKQFQFMGERLFAEGLTGSHGGSLSIREGDKIYITRKGAMLSALEEQDIIETDLSAKNENAAADLAVHQSIYANCAAQAVVFAQSPYAISLSLSEEKILPLDSSGRAILKSIPVIRVRDAALNDEVIKFLSPTFKSGYVAALVRGHGSYAIGVDLEDAYRNTSILEQTCKVSIISRKPASAPAPARTDKRQQGYRSAIPPSIGVMDRSYRNRDKR